MPVFNYVAINRSGKKIKDTLESPSLEQAKNSLRSTGYTIIEIAEQSLLNKDIEIGFLSRPKAKDMAIFCRQFVSILKAGVPISAVLSMLGQQTENKQLANAVRTMQADIEKGDTLAGAMRRQPHAREHGGFR